MERNLTILIGFILLIGISSCSTPTPIVKLTPSTLDTKDYWNMGQHFVFSTHKGVWFDCAFNCIDKDKIVYDVKISNESDTAILVDPELFHQKVYLNDSVVISHDYADSPETILDNLKWNENVAIAQTKNANILSICSTIISVGASIAVATSNKGVDKKINTLNAIAASNDLIQVSSASMAESANVRSADNWTRKKMLNEAFLRKTTLPKGTYIDGEVHFPYHKNANWYDLVFAVGNAKAYFYFKQEAFKPTISR
jgi:hypothetical protein